MVGWQTFSVVQLFAGNTIINPNGIFVYSGAPGPGNPPIFWSTPPTVTADPYGNALSNSGFGNPGAGRLQIDQFGELALFNSSDQLTMFLQPGLEALLIYTPPAGAGTLASSLAATSGTDNFGNHYLSGAAVYGASFATVLNAGFIAFYTGSLSGGWTFAGQIETDGSGDILISPNGSVTIASNATVSGTLSVNGSGSTAVPSPNATSTNGLSDGTIHGTSGGASAGTAHTHGPGSFAVGSGLHSHDTQNHTHVL